MKHQGLDYRISLPRAAAFHGSSHQAAMVFQVVVPRQLRDLEIGRHRLQFLYQMPGSFAQLNQPEWLSQIKRDAGFAKVAGVELTLLDCARYFHKAGGHQWYRADRQGHRSQGQSAQSGHGRCSL